MLSLSASLFAAASDSSIVRLTKGKPGNATAGHRSDRGAKMIWAERRPPTAAAPVKPANKKITTCEAIV